MINQKNATIANSSLSQTSTNDTAERAPIPMRSLSKLIPALIPTKYPMQELYLNKVDAYFKNTAERKKRIDYMIKERYNGSLMYGVDGILTPSNYEAIRDFIGEQKAKGITRVSMAYSSKSGIDKLIKFNASSIHTSSNTKIDNVISEYEPWVSSSGVTWAQFFDLLEYAQSKTYGSLFQFQTRAYLGWPHKPNGTNTDANVMGTIQGVDIPCLHVYTYGKPAYSYLRTRLQWYAKQAHLFGYTALKPLVILPIYSSEQEFGFNYFSGNHPELAHDAILYGFQSDSFPYKECLDLSKGFLMFKESDISKARP
jgi:hypothetical protein